MSQGAAHAPPTPAALWLAGASQPGADSDATQLRADDLRFARDGEKYSRAQFLEYYGEVWLDFWNSAPSTLAQPLDSALNTGSTFGTLHWLNSAAGTAVQQPVGGASQPPERLPEPANQLPDRPRMLLPPGLTPPATGGAAQPADATAGTGGDAQPADPPHQPARQLAARQWMETPFYSECLAAGPRNLMQAGVQYAKAETAREALNLAYQLYNWLPLSDTALSNGQLKDWLNISDALFVAAERVPRVSDANRAQLNRVDFFAYMPSGEVFRYHPGRTAKDDAHPHRMRADSQLFQFDVAAVTGVGSALHAVPPGFLASAGAPQPGVFAVTPVHLAEPSRYDVQSCSGQKLRTAMSVHHQPGVVVDITRGEIFPWWLAFASAPAGRDAIQDGIFAVYLSTHNEKPAFIVRNSVGRVRVTFGPKMGVANLD